MGGGQDNLWNDHFLQFTFSFTLTAGDKQNKLENCVDVYWTHLSILATEGRHNKCDRQKIDKLS